MIKNIKGLALFFASVFVFGLVFSFIPTQVFATTSGYVCSGDSSYDPREGSSSMPSGIYSDTYGHSWGVCKDGSQPTAPATSSSSNTTTTDNVIVKNDTCNSGFLGFPAWYRGLTNASCDVVSPGDSSSISLSGFIWTVVLNIVEMAMVAVAYVTVFFILYGGFQFLTSQGAPDGMAKARTTITNAVIGLIISLVAVGLINYIVTGLLI